MENSAWLQTCFGDSLLHKAAIDDKMRRLCRFLLLLFGAPLQFVLVSQMHKQMPE